MSYITAGDGNTLPGKVNVTDHAVKQFKKRYGDYYEGAVRIADLSIEQARHLIEKSIKQGMERIEKKEEIFEVYTHRFKFIIQSEFAYKSVVKTVINNNKVTC